MECCPFYGILLKTQFRSVCRRNRSECYTGHATLFRAERPFSRESNPNLYANPRLGRGAPTHKASKSKFSQYRGVKDYLAAPRVPRSPRRTPEIWPLMSAGPALIGSLTGVRRRLKFQTMAWNFRWKFSAGEVFVLPLTLGCFISVLMPRTFTASRY
ncbi:hypothetical protein EVAR_95790_1 [Eumeta japonica]|uniref:Uncharacterized protein n=1 Tax=Eumeta variegata TaxID=151549 RepID=A0A4C1W3R8_EUMVA|nr:hypothetical protein EVAR_95790_1 [Eumeta japonica]